MFLLAEDRALKAKIQGITVSDRQNPERPVKVWYRYPSDESEQRQFPLATIEMVDVQKSAEREHRGRIQLGYQPYGYPDPTEDQALRVDYPVPHDLYYQVTTYARDPIHDRQIMSQMLQYVVPHRYGYLEIEEDQTIRRVANLGMNFADARDTDNKRIFRKIFILMVSSEVPEPVVDRLVERVQQVQINLRTTPPATQVEEQIDIFPTAS